ncbi:MAG TPA: serine protease [Bryobacteraceae bacterium]|nr:serine protease [Bryobacteraceae bacterium]
MACSQVRRVAPALLFLALPAITWCDPVNWEAMKNGIVQISVNNARGTGVLSLAESGRIQIVTAAHLLNGARTAYVTFYWDRATPVAATVLPRFLKELDLAVLEVRTAALRQDIPSFAIRKNDSLALTERLYAANLDWTLVPINVVRLDSGEDPFAPDNSSDFRQLTYTQGVTGNGFSGGPIFDQNGQLAGIHRGSFGSAANRLSLGVKIESAKLSLQALGFETPLWGMSSILEGDWTLETYDYRNDTYFLSGSMSAEFRKTSVTILFPQGAFRGSFTFDGRAIHLKLTEMVNPFTRQPMEVPGGQNAGLMMQVTQLMGLDKFIQAQDGSFWTDANSTGSRFHLVRQQQESPQ